MPQTLNYHVERGAYFQRLVVVKDRRTHHVSPCTSASVSIMDATGSASAVPATITGEGAILITMDQGTTMAFTPGTYYFEVMANPYVYGYSSWGGVINPPYPPIVQRVANGTLEVTTTDYTNFLLSQQTFTNSGSSTTISQSSATLNLEWVEADPVSLAFAVAGVNWAGTYTAQVRSARSATATLMGTLTVTATFDGTNTNFTLSMSQANSALIPSGTYYWDLQQVGGVTRLGGVVKVDLQVTA